MNREHPPEVAQLQEGLVVEQAEPLQQQQLLALQRAARGARRAARVRARGALQCGQHVAAGGALSTGRLLWATLLWPR